MVNISTIQEGFVEALPRIERVARFRLRGLEHERREEAVAETVAIAWKTYRKLFLEGRDVAPLVGKIAEFAARTVRSGGGLTNINPLRDAMSPTCRYANEYNVEPLSDEIIDSLSDSKMPSPDEKAIPKMDFVEWLAMLDERQKRIVGHLLSGLNTVEVARLHGITRGRIYQLRLKMAESWDAFQE